MQIGVKSEPKAGVAWGRGGSLSSSFGFMFAPKLQLQRHEQNLPQVPIAWNIRAPALPSVLENRVRGQRMEGSDK